MMYMWEEPTEMLRGVDGIVFVSAPYELIYGSFVDVKITEANEYDLTGVIVE